MKQNHKSARVIAYLPVLIPSLLGSHQVSAQEWPANETWRFQITPYLWAANFGGDVRADRRLPTLHVDESFGDVLRDLDLGVFIAGLAVRDRLVLSADLSYVAVSRKGDLLANPPVSARGSLDQFSTTLLAGYRAVRQPGFDLDILGGGRVWSIGTDVQLRVAGTPFADASTTFTWVDPIIAVRARADLAPRLSALVIGDIGGFGAGSRFTWQVAGLLNYEVTPNLFASAGYRHLAFDYRDGGRRLDVGLSGPLLGLTYRF